jgi:hypothetical protein
MSRRGSRLHKNGRISSSDDQNGSAPDGGDGDSTATKKARSPGARAVRTTLMVVLVLFVIFYLVIPRLADQEATARQLRHVNPFLLLLAFGLEVGALVAYSILTKVTLPPEPKLSLFTIFRIQLSTKAVTNVVPGGSAAGGTLGYRLFTQAGVEPTAAGFTMATVGIGSAVVLNLLLWIVLLISIPLRGFQAAYVSAALVGVLLMGAAAFLVWSLMEGKGRSERVLRAIFRKIPFVKEETAARFVHQLADRLHDLAGQPDLIRRGMVWAALNWLVDAASLWVFLRAFGVTVDPIVLLVSYGVAQVAAAIPITPGGLGVVDGGLPTLLTSFGVPNAPAIAGVLSWRFVQYWLPIPLGGLSYLSLRFGKIGRAYRRQTPDPTPATSLRNVAAQRVWDEETGEFRWTRRGADPAGIGPSAPADLDDVADLDPTVGPTTFRDAALDLGAVDDDPTDDNPTGPTDPIDADDLDADDLDAEDPDPDEADLDVDVTGVVGLDVVTEDDLWIDEDPDDDSAASG